jgi:type II secretion system protein G
MFKHGSRGFTLIELLVVIAIIGILSSVVLASLNDARQKSRDAKRIADVKQLQLALELYFDSEGTYPNATQFAATDGTGLVPDYIAALPTDPVDGLNYQYAALGSGISCTDYHLGANLENSGHSALDADVDAAASTGVCTSGGTDFTGTDVAGTNCAGTASTGRTCYDVKP